MVSVAGRGDGVLHGASAGDPALCGAAFQRGEGDSERMRLV